MPAPRGGTSLLSLRCQEFDGWVEEGQPELRDSRVEVESIVQSKLSLFPSNCNKYALWCVPVESRLIDLPWNPGVSFAHKTRAVNGGVMHDQSSFVFLWKPLGYQP